MRIFTLYSESPGESNRQWSLRLEISARGRSTQDIFYLMYIYILFIYFYRLQYLQAADFPPAFCASKFHTRYEYIYIYNRFEPPRKQGLFFLTVISVFFFVSFFQPTRKGCDAIHTKAVLP